MDAQINVDLLIIGAGFAGLHMLHNARRDGWTARVVEAGDDVGGTWYWNRYPGARCDVESQQYSFSFAPELESEWVWTERFATQPEILKYAQFVADRLDLKRDIDFGVRIDRAEFDDTSMRWTVKAQSGKIYAARFIIAATGSLSVSRMPDITGWDRYRGAVYHTANWPSEGVDLSGKRVGVIGTGSSGIQAIPEVARQASQLVVFQRTPNFALPARNAPLSDASREDWKNNVDHYRALARTFAGYTLAPSPTHRALEVSENERQAEFEKHWQQGGTGFLRAFSDLMIDHDANATAADFVRAKIRSIVNNPNVAEILCPKDYPLGAKRICLDSNYFSTFNRDNVTLVDLRSNPIEEITQTGIRTDGNEYELDVVILATGFDAMTGALLAMDIRGSAGRSLGDEWKDGPGAHLGLMIAGFPNLFVVNGPGSPSVLTNMVVSIEHHIDWITECLGHVRRTNALKIEARREAQERWVEHVNEVAARTLYGEANSWYLGANVPGKPRVFMPYAGGAPAYRAKCVEETNAGYPSFEFTVAAIAS